MFVHIFKAKKIVFLVSTISSVSRPILGPVQFPIFMGAVGNLVTRMDKNKVQER